MEKWIKQQEQKWKHTVYDKKSYDHGLAEETGTLSSYTGTLPIFLLKHTF